VRHVLAQATAYLASAPKSNRAGLGYWAAMADVLESGSLPVPMHLRNAPVGRMRSHGIGVGYRYPHDFEGADVAQQYLPDALAERRYYVPSAEGLEARIGERLDRLRAEREAAADRPRPRSKAGLPKVDAMRTAGDVMKARQGKLARIAETQKGDAGG
jgi:putative ATPase